MGYEESGQDQDDVVVVTEETVLRRAGDKGLTVDEADDGISWRVSSGRKAGFFPKAFVAGGYTEAQLAMIEDAFRDCGVDLFPLNTRLH